MPRYFASKDHEHGEQQRDQIFTVRAAPIVDSPLEAMFAEQVECRE